jgi:ribosomal protein S18 acetylase RimI-like enzyme
MGEIFVAAEARRHRDWIVAAQAETAAISYGSPAAEAEASSLARRLDAALGAADTRIMVLEAGGAPVGYFLIEPRLEGQWFLLDLWIAPAQRSRGLGCIVLREALRHAARLGGSEVRLAVAARNQSARRLFAAEGFAVDDAQARDGCTWFEMRKVLPRGAVGRGGACPGYNVET